MRELIAGVPARFHARFICEEETLAFYGPTLLAARQRSLSSNLCWRCRSGLRRAGWAIAAVAGVIWLLFLIILTLGDYATRGWVPLNH